MRAPRTPIVEISAGAISAPERERPDDHALETAEDPRRDVGWRGPLQERHRGDVDHRVGEADDSERQRRDRSRSGRRRRVAAVAPEESPIAKSVATRARDHQRQRHGSAEQRPDAAGSLQHTDACRAEAEQLQRDRDDEHAERSGNDALGAVEPDQQAQPRLTGDRSEAGVQVALHPRAACRAVSATAGDRTREMKYALQANVRATNPKAAAGPPIASRKAAIAGPAKIPRLSNVLAETFAAVSSSGVGRAAGSATTRPGGRSCRASW